MVEHASTIRVAIAGAGFIGPVHIESLRRLPNVEVVAISHSSKDAAAEKASQFGIKNYYASFDEMILTEHPHCVHICTPNNLHYIMAKTAIQHGIHVVCEKPLALTVSEAVELLQLAKNRNVINAVCFNIRYYPLARQMKCMVETNNVGRIFSVAGSYLQDWLLYDADYNWRLDSEKSGSSKAVADIGSHIIDLIEYVSGLQVSEVMADFSIAHEFRKKPLNNIDTYSGKQRNDANYIHVPVTLEDAANILLRFSNGVKGLVTVSQAAAGRKNRVQLEINASEKSLAWCSEQPDGIWIGRRNGPNELLMRDPSLVAETVKNIISYPGGHVEGFGDTFKQLFKEIYADVRNGKPSGNPSYPTFADGLRELIICGKIVESNLKQAWIKVS